MIATTMLLPDYTLVCPHCDLPVWASETHQVSRTENEWDCKGCGRHAYWEYVPEHGDNLA